MVISTAWTIPAHCLDSDLAEQASMANGTAIGPVREVAGKLSGSQASATRILVTEGDAPADPGQTMLTSVQ